jgi:spermidine synthase
VPWLFLIAYTSSGLAGLIYQVCWTRLLTLSIGHTTGAASAVVAAFLGGLAVGAAAAGAFASRLTRRQALAVYALLELSVAAAALLLPLEMRAFSPLLAWAYADGASAVLFPTVRLLACLVMVFVPATALGATFPMAIRWFASEAQDRASAGGALYALNTAGAALGAVLAGFVLIPRFGVSGTTWIGVASSLFAAILVLAVARRVSDPARATSPRTAPAGRTSSRTAAARVSEPQWLAALILGLSGFAALVHEIAWTRVLTMVFGPTTYAFSATLAAVITGIAVGSGAGAWMVARTRRPSSWLILVLAAAAAAGILTSSMAGGPLPRSVAEQIAQAPNLFSELIWRGGLLTAALILPTSVLVGAAFPLALAMIDDPSRSAARQFGSVYAINTVGSVAGSLAAGFVFIPALGLEHTLRIVTVCLLLAAVLVLSFAQLSRQRRTAGALASAAAIAIMVTSAPWDRELLASGLYMYAPFVPKGVEIEPLLKAGSLLYYREGAAATVSVKRLTGTNTLAVDGKTDASNRGDMLTQKLVAHLPLLLHPQPRDVAVIGLGSGVTVGAVLTHPISRVDVVEISREVVEASHVFSTENRNALSDPRTNLLIADGRSHLQLSQRKYDVIISEPSNPWIAGIAALFTREFFLTARDRLAPGGLVCQWANAYNISDADLRAIVATFRSVFPDGTAWLVGADDIVLIASDSALDDRIAALGERWQRPGVADDLRQVGAVEPFALWSLFAAGPRELASYAGTAAVLTDDRMILEFSGPRELGARSAGENGAMLAALLDENTAPPAIRQARAAATAVQWRRRAAMMARRDAFSNAYEDYLRALRLDADDGEALDGFVRTAVITGRGSDALSWLDTLAAEDDTSPHLMVARSKLLASIGQHARALETANLAAATSGTAVALPQLASLHADGGDAPALDAAVRRMRQAMPDAAATRYYEAVLTFLRGDAGGALSLAEQALGIDPKYAAAWDLIGAAHSRRGDAASARQAFLASLTFDAHDSTAYASLGVLALEAGDTAAATDYFAEALWLDADSALAREGLTRATRAAKAAN